MTPEPIPDAPDPFEFEKMLQRYNSEFGSSMRRMPKQIAHYMTARAYHLSTIAHEPGLEFAIAAERDAVMLYAANATDGAATAFDLRLLGLVQGALSAAVAVLAR